MLRVTADTNILVSGLNFRRGKPFELLELARTGKILLAISDAILDEMADVLRREVKQSEYYHLVTAWKATREEEQSYAENIQGYAMRR